MAVGTDMGTQIALEYLTSKEETEKWHILPWRISVLCAQNRIEGAVKKGKMGLIPAEAEKPMDKRVKYPAQERISRR